MKVLFYDLETTGFGFDKCAIIQLAGIMTDIDVDGKIKPLDAINLKMRPRKGKMIDMRSLEINGNSVNDIMSWESDSVAYKKFVKFLLKYVDKFNSMDKIKLAGYNNSHFDSDFLRQWFLDNSDEFFGSYFWSDQIDVYCEVARYLLSYRPIINNFKLGNVADVLGITLDANALHDGLYDVKITLKIFKKILDSKQLILPFDENLAKNIFDSQQKKKDLFKKAPSSISEDEAWIIA